MKIFPLFSIKLKKSVSILKIPINLQYDVKYLAMCKTRILFSIIFNGQYLLRRVEE